MVDVGGGSVISVNSYMLSSTPEVMYGPYFGTAAQALYNAAQGDPPGGPATPAAGGLTALLQSLRTDPPAKKCKKQKKRGGKKKRCKRSR